MSWTPTPNQLAQTSHFFIATTVVLLAARIGLPWWAQGIAVLAWAVPKEFVLDPWIEGDSYADGLVDFSWYVVGGMVAMVGLLLA